jgi:hypothetical protein
MADPFQELLPKARDWGQRAAAGNWLSPADLRPLDELEGRSPASLFDAGTHRPLVAAFFGGTGVGKSSLLNRLAGQPIARTGVERPTSREVSLYIHQSVHLKSLPKDFPLERVRIAQHHDEQVRQVLWIDMPDFDSVEQANRDLVMEWLPHIDVLVYVVSPERYKDDKGWRILQSHGGEHAWLFVLNQWDRGHPSQYDDFRALLAKGGFDDPVILRTDCRENASERKPDDFEQLRSFLQEMADRHVMLQLEIRAESMRLEGLTAALKGCLRKLGEGLDYRDLREDWETLWENTSAELAKGMEWPIAAVAQAFVGREANPLRRNVDLTKESPPQPEEPRSLLWDEWAESRLKDALDRLVVDAGEKGLPVLPLKAQLDGLRERAGPLVLGSGQRSLRQALANPGNAFQRIGLKLAGTLSVLLPLAAIGWATYEVVQRFYESAVENERLAFLGQDFAIHALLLIGLSWLLPFFAYRQLKPSAERTAVKGLREGIRTGLDSIGTEVEEVLEQADRGRAALLEEGRRLAKAAETATVPVEREATGLLRRVLPAARVPKA